MIVTKIERQKRNRRRVNIYLDGAFAFGVHDEVLLRAGIRKGDDLTEEALGKITASEESRLAKSRALRLLSRRLRSESELRSDLLEHEFHPATVEGVLVQLREHGLVDDLRFSKSYVHDARMRRALGRIALVRELRRKGIAPSVIREALSASAGPGKELEVATDAASKLLARYRTSRREVTAQRQRERTAQFLARRGFDWETIERVMRGVFGEGES